MKMLHWIIAFLISIFILSLRLGGDIDGTLCGISIKQRFISWIYLLHYGLRAYSGNLGSSQIQLAALGSI
jgi:hypothetical protein